MKRQIPQPPEGRSGSYMMYLDQRVASIRLTGNPHIFFSSISITSKPCASRSQRTGIGRQSAMVGKRLWKNSYKRPMAPSGWSLERETTTNRPAGFKTRRHSLSRIGIWGVSKSSTVKLEKRASKVFAGKGRGRESLMARPGSSARPTRLIFFRER